MWVAAQAGIKIFATGGIGGVHRGQPFDVSADLPELAQTPVVVVCAGAKAILDLPLTLEWLETHGVPVLGFETDTFPAFYSLSSGLPVDARCDTAEAAAQIIRAKFELGLQGGVLIGAPIPAEYAVANEDIEPVIQQALKMAEARAHSRQGHHAVPVAARQRIDRRRKHEGQHRAAGAQRPASPPRLRKRCK